MTRSVEQYLSEGCGRCELGNTPSCKVHIWVDELQLLRSILNHPELKEESKWGVICYTFNGKNIAILSAYKEACVLGFFKGILLNHTNSILQKSGPNSHESRVIKFTSVDEVESAQAVINDFIEQAIEHEKAGTPIPPNTTSLPIPEELKQRFKEDPNLELAFEALTPGRQKGYLIHFNSAKQSQTRYDRIDKNISKILKGEGMNDYIKKN